MPAVGFVFIGPAFSGNGYCKWAGVRLPTLDEWEVTARANSNTEYFLGSDKKELAQYANVWVVYQFEIR